MNNFVHLHVHTEYSLLDGHSRLENLILTAKEKGMDSIAITDHGSMFGVVEFFKLCKKHKIKPIIGCEIYVSENSHLNRNSKEKIYHLVLLAENNEGYHNLIKIVSEAYVNGFYYKPRVDKDFIRKHSKGIISTSACMGGEVQRFILEGNYEKAIKAAKEYKEIFGEDNFFLELQDHGIPEQQIINKTLIKMSKELEIPLIASNDLHYVNREDAKIHDVVLCIQTGKTINEEGRMKFPSDEFYLKDYDEMNKFFGRYPEALENTVKIAERCNVELEFGAYHLPHFDSPEGFTNEEYLRYLTIEGIKKRYTITPEVKDRVETELSTISSMGYVDYFLIVWDFINYAKSKGIPVGPGRGSAAGSIVSYALGITNIDPLKYSLLFERFLNPERVSMPDIDIDFCYERRDEVIEYVIKKYGNSNVAQIVTFGTMQAKMAIRDVGRAMDISYAEVDKVAKMIPSDLGMTIDKALKINTDLKNEYETNFEVQRLIDYSRAVEGMPRHTSTHAAGVVITEQPVTDYVPLSRNQDIITTQYNMIELEELGLLKMDFLGLRTLTVIDDALKLIKYNHGIEVDIDNIDLNDPKVLKLFEKSDTLGVFQFESAGMRNFLKQLKPSRFDDLVAANSLFRPGPMNEIPNYINNKYNPEQTTYIHPALEPILNVTYGTIVYQEQVMQIVQRLAGYSLGEADLLRRAMSKKKMDVMERERGRFIDGEVDSSGNIIIEGCIRRGIDRDSANQIFDLMIDFAKYAFNKSHSVAYAYVAMQTAWLKTYYKTEFMAALMSSVMDSKTKISQYIGECERMGIKMLPPNINKSYKNFSVEEDKVRFGLAAVKNVGSSLVESITKERDKNGPYPNFTEFVRRIERAGIQSNKRAVESLIKVGAFSDLGTNRASLISSFEKTMDSVHRSAKNNIQGQMNLLEGMNEEIIPQSHILPEYSKEKLLEMEKELTGLYISGHPLNDYSQDIDKKTNFSNLLLADEDDFLLVKDKYDGNQVTVLGMVVGRKDIITRKNDKMCFIDLEDQYGVYEITVFPRQFSSYNHLIQEENVILVSGSLSLNEEEKPKILANKIQQAQTNSAVLYIQVENSKVDLTELKQIARANTGASPIVVWFKQEKKGGYSKDNLKIDPREDVINKLKNIYGKENVVVK